MICKRCKDIIKNKEEYERNRIDAYFKMYSEGQKYDVVCRCIFCDEVVEVSTMNENAIRSTVIRENAVIEMLDLSVKKIVFVKRYDRMFITEHKA